MSRGRPPRVAIAEAKEYASGMGFHVIDILAPCADFMISRDDRVIMVRVRRLRTMDYEPACISASCSREIEGLRESPVSGTIGRELWARGPDRTWHRYQVEAERIVPLTGVMRER
jgi:hypothetical protein